MRSSVIVLALLAAGCGVTLRAGRPPRAPSGALTIGRKQTAHCVRSIPGAGSPYREPLQEAVTDPELRRVLERFPARARRTAVAAGVEPLLARLLRERERTGGAPTPELLEMRLELAERVSSLPGQLLATEFECECVIAAIDEALHEHEGAEAARELSLTIGTLVAGAAFGLASGVWDLANSHARAPAVPDGPIITSIAGAVVTTGLGVAMLVPAPREIVFVHDHNLLRPVVQGGDDQLLFPTFVFRLLTMPLEDGQRAPREKLLASFRERVAEAVEPGQLSVARSIVYGAGGVYDPALLQLHRDFLAELESTLDSLARHVDELARAIANALAEPPARPAVDPGPAPPGS